MKKDWSPRSRTSNPQSRSPAALVRAVAYGKWFATSGLRGNSGAE
jgi:hypothetical protein